MAKEFSYKDEKKFWAKRWVRKKQTRKLRRGDRSSESKRIVSHFRELNIPCKSFLEIGCGLGRNIWWFYNEFPEWKYTGIDINPKAQEVVLKHYPGLEGKVKVFSSDALTFLKRRRANSFDVVFTFSVLQHITEDVIEQVCKLMEKVAASALVIYEAKEKRLERPPVHWRFFRDYRKFFTFPCVKEIPFDGEYSLLIFSKPRRKVK